MESKTERGQMWRLPWSASASTSTSATFDPGLATPATSLDLEAGRRISRQALLVSLLKSLERETLGLLDPAALGTIPKRVEQASTWIRGRRVEVHGPQACTGVTTGLDENGFLLVRTAERNGDGADRRHSRRGDRLRTMLLALDVGNTNTVLGLYRLDGAKPPALAAHWRVTTHRTQTVDEYGVFFVNLFEMNGMAPAR